jgi:hypothetical protein
LHRALEQVESLILPVMNMYGRAEADGRAEFNQSERIVRIVTPGLWQAVGLSSDYDELERWTGLGYQSGMRSRKRRAAGAKTEGSSRGADDMVGWLGLKANVEGRW